MAKSQAHYDAPAQQPAAEDPGLAAIRAGREARKGPAQAQAEELSAREAKRRQPLPTNVPANQPAGQGAPLSPPPAPAVHGTYVGPPPSGQPANKKAAKSTRKVR